MVKVENYKIGAVYRAGNTCYIIREIKEPCSDRNEYCKGCNGQVCFSNLNFTFHTRVCGKTGGRLVYHEVLLTNTQW